MAKIHKAVYDAARGVMADTTYGFNACLTTISSTYGLGAYNTHIPPVWVPDVPQITWTTASKSVFSGHLTQDGQRLSQLDAGLELVIWSGMSLWTGETKGMKWSGRVELHLDFTITTSARLDSSDTVEQDQTLTLAEAVFDAVVETFCRAAITWGTTYSVVFAAPPSSPEWSPLEQLEDGWRQQIPIVVGFRVDVPY
jgi:hypothetical protein